MYNFKFREFRIVPAGQSLFFGLNSAPIPPRSRLVYLLVYLKIEIKSRRALRIVLDFVLRRPPNLSATCLYDFFCNLAECQNGFPSSTCKKNKKKKRTKSSKKCQQ